MRSCRPAHVLQMPLTNQGYPLLLDGQPVGSGRVWPVESASSLGVPHAPAQPWSEAEAAWHALQQQLVLMGRGRLRAYQRERAVSTLDGMQATLGQALGACLEGWFPGLSTLLKALLEEGAEQDWLRLVLELTPGPWAELPWELAALPLLGLDALGWSQRLSVVRLSVVIQSVVNQSAARSRDTRDEAPDWSAPHGPLRIVQAPDLTAAPPPASHGCVLGARDEDVLLEARSCDDHLIPLGDVLARLHSGVRAFLSHAGVLEPTELELDGLEAVPLDRGLQLYRRRLRQAERLDPAGLAPLRSRLSALWVRSLCDLNVGCARMCRLRISGSWTHLSIALIAETEVCADTLDGRLLLGYGTHHAAHAALLRSDDGLEWRRQLGLSLLALLPVRIQAALRQHVDRAQAGGALLTLEVTWPEDVAEPVAHPLVAPGHLAPQEPSLGTLLERMWWETLGPALVPEGGVPLLVQQGVAGRSPALRESGPLRAWVVALDAQRTLSASLGPPAGMRRLADALEQLMHGVWTSTPQPMLVLERLLEDSPRALQNALSRQPCHCVVLLAPDPFEADEGCVDGLPLGVSEALQRIERLAPHLVAVPLLMVEGGPRGLPLAHRLSRLAGVRLVSARQAGTSWMGQLLGCLSSGQTFCEAFQALAPRGTGPSRHDLVLLGGPWEGSLVPCVSTQATSRRLQRDMLAIPWRTFLFCRWVIERREQQLFLQARDSSQLRALRTGLVQALTRSGRRLHVGLGTARRADDVPSGIPGNFAPERRLRRLLSDSRSVLWLEWDTLSPEVHSVLPALLHTPLEGSLVLVSERPAPLHLQGPLLAQAIVVGHSMQVLPGPGVLTAIHPPSQGETHALLFSRSGCRWLGLKQAEARRAYREGRLVRDPLQVEWGYLLEPAETRIGMPDQAVPLVPAEAKRQHRRWASALAQLARALEQASTPPPWTLVTLPTCRSLWLEARAHALAAGAAELAWQAQCALDALCSQAERTVLLGELSAQAQISRRFPELWLHVARDAGDASAFRRALTHVFTRERSNRQRELRLQAMVILLDLGLPRFGLSAVPDVSLRQGERAGRQRRHRSSVGPQTERPCGHAEQEDCLTEHLAWLHKALIDSGGDEQTPLEATAWRAWAHTQLDRGVLSPEETLTHLSRCSPSALEGMSSLEALRLAFVRFSCWVALERFEEARTVASFACADEERTGEERSRWKDLYSGYMQACLLLFQSPLSEGLPWVLERTRHHARMLGHVTLELRCYYAMLCDVWARRDRQRFDACVVLHQRCAERAGLVGLSAEQREGIFPWSETSAEGDHALRPEAGAGQGMLVNFVEGARDDATLSMRRKIMATAHQASRERAPKAPLPIG